MITREDREKRRRQRAWAQETLKLIAKHCDREAIIGELIEAGERYRRFMEADRLRRRRRADALL